MKKTKLLVTLLLSATMAVSPVGAFAAEEPPAEGESLSQAAELVEEQMLAGRDYAEDQLIVTYDSSKKNKEIKEEVRDHDGTCERITALNDEEKMARITVSDEDQLAETIVKLTEDPEVISVQPNYRYRIQGADPMLDPSSRKYQYFHRMIKSEEAWDLLEEGNNQKQQALVAILDTGVDAKHVDLQANIQQPGKYISCVGGKRTEVTDDAGDHGTHVAGIVGATYGNGIFGSGVASGHNNQLVKFMMVGTSPDGEYLYTFDIVNAVNYAVEEGAQVVNMSFGLAGRDRVEEAAILDGYNKGVVFTSAAGNESSNEYSDPCGMKEVISVIAASTNGEPAFYSDYGITTDIAAPGSSIYSTLPGDQFGLASGTSMASPIVAGVAAMMLDANPNLTPAQVYNIMCASTDKTEYDKSSFGYGMVDAEACVRNAMNASADIPVDDLTVKKGEYNVYTGDDISIEALVRPATSLAEITWTSSDPSIAEVDPVTGHVTGIAKGTVTITAEAGGKTAQCEVSVLQSVESSMIQIKNIPYQNEMAVGQKGQLIGAIMPSNATNKEIYWESSDRDVIAIDELGYIEAVGTGQATITAYSYDRRVSESVDLTVKPPAERVQITRKTNWLQMGDKFTFAGRILNAQGTSDVAHNRISWNSSNTTIAKVNNKTGEITPVRPGTFYVMAEYINPMIVDDLNTDEDGYYLFYRVAMKKVIIAKKNYSGKDYGLKQKAKTKKSVTLSWKKIPIAEGYVIQSAAKKKGKFRTIKVIKSGKTLKFKYKTKKNRYYRIRAYYTKNGKKKYFSYSKVVLAKVKK